VRLFPVLSLLRLSLLDEKLLQFMSAAHILQYVAHISSYPRNLQRIVANYLPCPEPLHLPASPAQVDPTGAMDRPATSRKIVYDSGMLIYANQYCLRKSFAEQLLPASTKSSKMRDNAASAKQAETRLYRIGIRIIVMVGQYHRSGTAAPQNSPPGQSSERVLPTDALSQGFSEIGGKSTQQKNEICVAQGCSKRCITGGGAIYERPTGHLDSS
jgi:hypothetical protein